MMIKPVKSVQAINRYKGVQPAKKESSNTPEKIKLDGNENPYGLPVSIRLSEADYQSLQLYPDPLSSELTELIASKEKLSADNVFVSSGSDELIDLLIRGYVEKDELVLTISPTFGMYQYLAEVNGVKFKSIEMELQETSTVNVVRYQLDEELFLQEAEKAKLIFLARPNNPDGQLVPIEFILQLLRLNVLVTIDEAYIDFATQPTLVNYLKEYENLILLRTFSKAYALGGVRIGYGLLSKDIKDTLLTIKQPYNVNTIAQKLASTAFNSQAIINNVQKMIKTRKYFISELIKLASDQEVFQLHLSEGPYVLLTFSDRNRAFSFYQFMKNNGILIRYYDPKATTTNIRISIGQDNQMTTVLSHINMFLESS